MKELKPHSEMNRDQRAIYELLEQRGKRGATTTEIQEAGFNGYRARLSEMRHDFNPPIDVKCFYEGMTDDNRKIHRYYLPQFAPVSSSENSRRTYLFNEQENRRREENQRVENEKAEAERRRNQQPPRLFDPPPPPAAPPTPRYF